MSHTVSFGAGRHTVYGNVTTPANVGAGSNVNDPSGSNVNDPAAGSDNAPAANTEPAGYDVVRRHRVDQVRVRQPSYRIIDRVRTDDDRLGRGVTHRVVRRRQTHRVRERDHTGERRRRIEGERPIRSNVNAPPPDRSTTPAVNTEPGAIHIVRRHRVDQIRVPTESCPNRVATASGPTTIVCVAVSHTVSFGAARHTVYGNVTTPANVGAGSNVNEPSGLNVNTPAAGSSSGPGVNTDPPRTRRWSPPCRSPSYPPAW